MLKIAEPNLDLVKDLLALSISGILAALLVNRGLLEIGSARRFLYFGFEYPKILS
jgi:hypothetical protein